MSWQRVGDALAHRSTNERYQPKMKRSIDRLARLSAAERRSAVTIL